MHKEKIEEILNKYKLINLENELYMKKIINTYLMKNEEIICEECGADNDDRDCVVAYEVL